MKLNLGPVAFSSAESCICSSVHKLSYQSTVLRKCRVCFIHSFYDLHKESWTWKHWRCVWGGEGVWVCVCKHTSFAIFYQHCCWCAAHRALQRFEHSARVLNGCYSACFIRFDLHAMGVESSLWKGILMHLQCGLKSNTFVQVWVPTVFLAAIRMKWACFGGLVHCHIPQCSLKWLKAQSLESE